MLEVLQVTDFFQKKLGTLSVHPYLHAINFLWWWCHYKKRPFFVCTPLALTVWMIPLVWLPKLGWPWLNPNPISKTTVWWAWPLCWQLNAKPRCLATFDGECLLLNVDYMGLTAFVCTWMWSNNNPMNPTRLEDGWSLSKDPKICSNILKCKLVITDMSTI